MPIQQKLTPLVLLLAILPAGKMQNLLYHFVANFVLFLRPFCIILPVEGAIAPANRPYQ